MREQKHETRARKAKLAISYITIGTLLVVWSLVWLIYLSLPSNVSGSVYIAGGIVLSGIAVVLIGINVGDIGKGANCDEEENEQNDQKVSSGDRQTRDDVVATSATPVPSHRETV